MRGGRARAAQDDGDDTGKVGERADEGAKRLGQGRRADASKPTPGRTLLTRAGRASR
jgi:hypothetical protein